MFLEVFSSSFPPFAILTNSYVNPLNRIHPLSNSLPRSPPSFNVPSPFLSPEIRGPKIVDFDIDRFIPPPHREIYCTIYFIKYNVKEKIWVREDPLHGQCCQRLTKGDYGTPVDIPKSPSPSGTGQRRSILAVSQRT